MSSSERDESYVTSKAATVFQITSTDTIENIEIWITLVIFILAPIDLKQYLLQ